MDNGTAILILALVEGLQLFGLILISRRSAREITEIKAKVYGLISSLQAIDIDAMGKRLVKNALDELKPASKQLFREVLEDKEFMEKAVPLAMGIIAGGLKTVLNELGKGQGGAAVAGGLGNIKLPGKIFGIPSGLIAPFIQAYAQKQIAQSGNSEPAQAAPSAAKGGW